VVGLMGSFGVLVVGIEIGLCVGCLFGVGSLLLSGCRFVFIVVGVGVGVGR